MTGGQDWPKKVVKAINLVLEDSVEFRVRDVLEEKLGVIFREFGIDKTSDVLDSEDGAHMFDKLFVDALLEPTKIEKGVEDVVDAVRNGASWNREQLNVLGDDEEEVSLEKDVSTQPVRDYLDILVRSHVWSQITVANIRHRKMAYWFVGQVWKGLSTIILQARRNFGQ